MTDTIALRDPAFQLRAAVPTFLVADVSSTAQRYADKLGFRTAGMVPTSEPYSYASLQRDGVELMLLRLAGYQKPDLTARRPEGVWDAYVRMQGVHAFYVRRFGAKRLSRPR
jgi:hypothetical protein